jgi:DNA polymerase III sliding clamp (beta) subunit (PCNA family)
MRERARESEREYMDTIERETVTDTLTVSAVALSELLEGASTHADKGKSALRALSSVEIKGEGGRLIARATDRYRGIVGEIDGEGGDLAPSLIALDDVKRVIALSKDSKLARLAFNRIGNLLTVSVSGSAITIQLLDDNYPPSFDDLFAKGEPTPMGEIAFNPAYMADYSKINAKSKLNAVNPVKLQFRGANMPIHIVLIGDKVKWRALLMPMKII